MNNLVGQKILVRAIIANIGNLAAYPAVYSYIDQAGGYSELDLTNNTCSDSTRLDPGKSCISAYYFTFSTSGTKTMKIRVDPQNQVAESNESNNDSSFSIQVNAATTPSIQVLSPNGGEVWQIGSTQTISWRTTNISSPNDKMTIYIIPAGDTSKNINLAQQIPNTGSYTYTVEDPSKYSYRSSLYQAGNQFKIFVCAQAANNNDLCSYAVDYSDAPFSIVAATQQLTVDLKVNGSDNPSSIPYDSTFTASWASTGARDTSSCAASGHYVPLVDGGLWTDLNNLPSSGNKTLYARHQNYGYTNPLEMSIQCFNAAGQSVIDKISIPVTQQTATTTEKTCSELTTSQQYYFGVCKDGGFDNVCFNKYSGVYQGCTKNTNNDCTVNNMNAAVNMLCPVQTTAGQAPVSTQYASTIDAIKAALDKIQEAIQELSKQR